MLGRKKKEFQQAMVLAEIAGMLETLLGEVRALRADMEKDRVPPEGERDPDVLTEGERVNKWIMGENGDGI